MAQTSCGFDNDDGLSGSNLLVRFGPTLLVDIGFDAAYDPTQPEITPIASAKGVRALIDTGATANCIDDLLAGMLGLPIVDKRPVSGVHGLRLSNMYLGQLHIPGLETTIYGIFVGVDLAGGGQRHSALIGRAFLQHFTMTYDGRNGDVIISDEF